MDGATAVRVGADPVEVSHLDRSAGAEWDAFVAAHPGGSAAHRHLWSDLIERVFGHETHYLAARGRDGGLRGILPLVRLRSLLFGDYMVSVPYLNYGGALALDQPAESALLDAADELARSRGCSHVELRYDRPLPEPLAAVRALRTDKVAMVLELPADEDALAKSLGSKLRSQIRRPRKEGAVVVRGGRELLDDFYAVFARNMRDLGTPVYPRRFFAAILDALGERAELVVVRLGDLPVAAGFLMGHQGCLEIPWASSDRRYNRLSANMLLYWEVLRGAVERGYERFDFGRSTRDAGTYRFKAQWGARPRQLRWYYWLPPGGEMPSLTPSSAKYRLAIRAWQRLPLPVANAIGPHIVKNLP